MITFSTVVTRLYCRLEMLVEITNISTKQRAYLAAVLRTEVCVGFIAAPLVADLPGVIGT